MSSNQWDINIQKSFDNCFYTVIFWAVSDSLHIFHAEACYLWLTLPSAKMSLNSLATSCVANSALKVLLTGVSTLKSRADQVRSSSSLRARLFFLTRPGPSLQTEKKLNWTRRQFSELLMPLTQAGLGIRSSAFPSNRFFLLTANMGLVLLIYLYSFHRAICRLSDHSVVRSRAEIRTRDGRI